MFDFLLKLLIVLFVLVLLLFIVYLILKHKFKKIFNSNFSNNDIRKLLEMSKKESIDVPKSLSSMEKFIVPNLLGDFPDLNIQQIKSIAEGFIVDCLNAIEMKDISCVKKYGDRAISFVNSRILDLGNNIIRYDSINIHKTVLNKYSKTDSIATLYLQTSFEYLYKKNSNVYKKVQDKIKTEFIYIIDESRVGDNVRAIGLNCPNCGAPITKLGVRKCEYCNSANLDIVRKTWNLNNFSFN